MQVSKMEEADKDADLRQPSINTEPRTLDESSIERATLAAQKIYAQHPEPTSDCFIKADEIGALHKMVHLTRPLNKCCHDAIDSATRENAPAGDAADALGATRENAPAEVAADALGATRENAPAEVVADALGATRENAPAEVAADALGATRENAPAEVAPDALGAQLDELVTNAGNLVDTDFSQSKATVRTESTPAAAPPQEPST